MRAASGPVILLGHWESEIEKTAVKNELKIHVLLQHCKMIPLFLFKDQ